MVTGTSLHIGLNSVNPRHYAGWSGPLQACEFDARDMERIARQAGFRTSTLLTRHCTRAAFAAALRQAITATAAGDIFLCTFSGHGGQLPARLDDELDKLDETLCFHDGEWL